MLDLFPDDFMGKLYMLRDRLAPLISSMEFMLPSATGHGMEPEVEEHRPYIYGDDPKMIDWNIHARMQKPFVKLMKRETEGIVNIFLDSSRSCFEPCPDIFRRGLEVGCAVAFLSLAAGNKVRIFGWSERLSFVSSLYSGEKDLGSVMDALSSIHEGAGTDLGKTMNDFLTMNGEGNFKVVLISDMVVAGEQFKTLEYLGIKNIEVYALRLYHKGQVQFPYRGRLELFDPETGRAVRCHAGSLLAKELKDKISDFEKEQRENITKRAKVYQESDVNVPFEKTVEQLLLKGQRLN